MLELVLAIAELLGATSLAFRARQGAAAPVFVASWVASLVFAVVGFIVAGPIAWAVPSLHPLLTISATFLALLVLTTAAVLGGVNPGCSLRGPAVLSYAMSFFLGGYALVVLARAGA